MAIMDLFKGILLVQLFYALVITIMLYSVPADTLYQVQSFSDVASQISLESVGTEVQDGLEKQTNIPVVELGALVFYSGNILIDLLLNFAFAIPEMLGLLINSFMLLFNLDSYLFAIVELFAAVVVMVMYFIAVIQLLTGVRSGRLV